MSILLSLIHISFFFYIYLYLNHVIRNINKFSERDFIDCRNLRNIHFSYADVRTRVSVRAKVLVRVRKSNGEKNNKQVRPKQPEREVKWSEGFLENVILLARSDAATFACANYESDCVFMRLWYHHLWTVNFYCGYIFMWNECCLLSTRWWRFAET